MKEQSKVGGNMLLLAGLGIGAILLLSGKGKAGAGPALLPSDVPMPDGHEHIPDTPKILAVNTSTTESPAPTAIVSDEVGMEAVTTPQLPQDGPQPSGKPTDAGQQTDSRPSIETSSGSENVPEYVSTKLTAGERSIIDKAPLTPALALKRPDLYKAAYIKRYGGKTVAGKRQALVIASKAISYAVADSRAAKNGALLKAVLYPAKPEYTFIQSAGGMTSQNQVAALARSGITATPAAQKAALQMKAGAKAKRFANVAAPLHKKKKKAARLGTKKTGGPLKKRTLKK